MIRRLSYSHPIFTRQSVETQSELPRMNGRNRTHFCGAYFGNGFHEDGCRSGFQAAEMLRSSDCEAAGETGAPTAPQMERELAGTAR